LDTENKIEEKRPKKILIIQTAFLGDVILALPMIQTLKNLIPDSEIDFLCIPNTANILENNPSVNKIIKFDKKGKDKLGKLFNIISDIREEHYDVILCPHRSFRSALITYFSRATVRIGFDRNSYSFLLTHKVQYDKKAHEIQRNLDLISAIPGLDLDETKISDNPKLYPTEKDIKIVDTLFKPINLTNSKNSTNSTNLKNSTNSINSHISFAPCSKWFTKQLTKDKSIEIIKGLIDKKYSIVLLGGAEDFNFCKEIEKEISNESLLNLCGRLTPIQSEVAISKSSVLITVDSAAQHLGAVTDTPIVLIYGSTNSSFGFYPLKSEHVIIEDNNLDCRPCTDHGRTECPLGHFKCIKDLDTEEIIKNALNLSVEKK
jgi:heptosyltransferase-2